MMNGRSDYEGKPENQLSGIIVNTCYQIHSRPGPGLLESVYEEILHYQLKKKNLIVEDKFLIELKSVEALAAVHYKQVLTYLKLTKLKLGLPINFNDKLIKTGIKRVVTNL